jgi:hypothetical protein
MAITDFPGLNWINRKRRENEARRAELEFHIEMMNHKRSRIYSHPVGEDAITGYAGMGHYVGIDNDSYPLFDLLAYQTADAIDEASFREMQRRMHILYKSHPLVSGWIKLMTEFIVGDNFQMKSKDEDPKTQEVWDKTAENMAGPWASRPWPFQIFARELVNRTLEFGEDFQREFVNEIDGSCCYRKMHPVWIYNPGAIFTGYAREWTPNMIASFGIQTDPEDLMHILYYYHDAYRNGRIKTVPGERVVHTKIGEADMKRGEPVMLCVVEYLIELEKILKARRKLHQLRTEVAWWDEIPEGASPDLLKALSEDDTITDGGVNDGRTYANQSGSTALLNGLKRTYATPSLQAADGDEDVKRILKCISVGLMQSFWMTSGDLEESTQASLREAIFPQTKAFEGRQRFFATTFDFIGSRVIKEAIDKGTLSPMSTKTVEKQHNPNGGSGVSKSTERCPRNVHFDCIFPEIAIRDTLAFANAITIDLANKLISRRQAQIERGVDPRQMDKEIAQDELMAQKEGEELATIEELLSKAKGGNNGDGKGQRTDEKSTYRHAGTRS